MPERFEIRQLARTIKASKMCCVWDTPVERLARDQYAEWVKEFPDTYLELVVVRYEEECLEFTAKAK